MATFLGHTVHAMDTLDAEITWMMGLCGCCSPWRIVDDCGGAFAMGAIGGSVFHSIKGFRNAPSVWNALIIFLQI